MRSASRLALSNCTLARSASACELVELGLVPARINHEQHVAFLHQLPGLKTHFLDVTGNARADFHGFTGSVRPVNSSHSTISFCSTGATVTAGAAAFVVVVVHAGCNLSRQRRFRRWQ